MRPVDPDWETDKTNPLETKDSFFIRSGRRPLEACRALGRSVRAVIATVQGDRDLADPEERFHENTMRRNLNGFEELISIGSLVESLREPSQTEIAERLNVGQGDVSLGLACLEVCDQIIAEVEVSTTPKRQYRAIIPKLKRGERLRPLLPPARTGDVVQSFDIRGIPITAKKQAKGSAIQIRNTNVAEKDLEAMPVDLAKVVMKYQIKKP